MERLTKKSYEFEDGFVVWRMLEVASKSYLIVELRNAQVLETVFVCIDFKDNTVLWDDVSFENAWSYSLSHCDSNFVYIKEFEDIDQPLVKASLSVEIATKQIAWYKEHCTIEEVYDNGVLLISEKTAEDSHHEKWIDAESGAEVGQVNQSLHPIKSHIIFPYSYKEGTEHFNTAGKFLKEREHLAIVQDCHYLEFNSYIIIGFYTLNNKKVNHHIFLYNSSGELLHKDLLGSDLKGIASDTFFIAENTLIYIKEKKEIVTLFLKHES